MPSPSSAPLPPGADSAQRISSWLPWLVLALGLLVTAVLVGLAQRRHAAEVLGEFERLGARVADGAQVRLAAPELALRGAQAALSLHRGEPDLAGLAAFVGSLARAGDYPGVTSIAFARAAPAAGDDTAAPARGFTVQAVEPAPLGTPALGADLATDPVFGPTLDAALRRGDAALGATQARPGTAGLALVLPVYRPEAVVDDEPKRRRAVIGALLATLDPARALAPVIGQTDAMLDVALHDGAAPPGAPPIFATAMATGAGQKAAPWTDIRHIDVAGRSLHLQLASTSAFDARHSARLRMAALAAAGALLSVLTALLVRLLATGRARALALAQSMTADLDRLAQAVRHTAHAVVIIDAARRIEWVNPAFETIAGRTAAELNGQRLRDLGLLAENDRTVIEAMVQAQDEGRAYRCELCLKAPAGGRRWIDVDMQPRLDTDERVVGFLVLGTDVTERHEAMRTLARQRAQLKAVLAGANCGIAQWHVPSGAVHVDERFEQLLGLGADESNAWDIHRWSNRFHVDDRAAVRAMTLELVRGQRSEFALDLRLRHARGHWIWMQVRASVVERTAAGRAEWLSAIYLDIGERKLAEVRWQLRGELSSDWYWQTDAEHRVEEVAGRFANGTRAVPEEYLGMRRDQITWFDPPEGGWDSFNAMLDRHEPFKGIVYRSHAPGGDRWTEIDGRPRFDDAGRFVGYAGVGREITERLRVTQQLRESLAVLDALFASLAIPVAMKDRQGRLQRVNPAYAQSIGLPIERIVGRTLGELLDAEAAERHEAEDRAIMQTRQPRHYEAHQRHPDGREVDTLVYKSPLVGPDGTVLGIVGTALDITERLETERALERERERLVDMIAGANAAAGEWDLRAGTLRLDERFARMLGLCWPDEVPRDLAAWRERVHPEDLAAVDRAVAEHLRGNADHVGVDLRLRHENGHWVWVHLRGRVTGHDAEGRATRITGAHFDVTDRRVAAELWKARAELSGDWFWQTDAAHRFIAMVTGDRYQGLTRGPEVFGRRRDEMPWIDPPAMGWAAFHAMLDRHEPFKGLAYLNHTDPDDPRWIEIDGRPRVDDGGRFQGYDGVGRDVTERRRVTAQLERSLAQLDALIGAVPIPLVMKDRHGRNTRVNRAYCEFYGVTEGEVLGRTVFDFWPTEVAARYHAEDIALMADRRRRSSVVQAPASTGQQLDILVHKSPIVGADGEVIGIVGAVVDLTEQRAASRALLEAKEAAESANRAKSAFLATMSHEIRTPMNGVIGMAELLAHTELAEDQARQVRTIVDSARSLLGILDDILDFSKIEAGRLELESAEVELEPLVDSACDALAPLALAGDVAVHVHVDPKVPGRVVTDPTRLRQIITNLLGNAIKFSARGGRPGAAPARVRVRLGSEGDAVVLSVADNGIGMDDATLARLFVPFSQGEVSTTRRFGGTGLGLAIIQRLVEMMRGRIEVDSRPGQGACFRVRLPLRALEDPAAAPAAAEALLAGVVCTVPPDASIDSEDLAAWLRDAGAALAENGADALPGAASPVRVCALPAGAMPPRDASAMQRDAEPSPAGPPMQTVFVGHGRAGEVRLLAPDAALIDQPRRASLVRAVAVVAGRASPRAAAPVLPSSDGAAPLSTQQHLILVAEDDPTNRLVIERQLELLGYRTELAHDGEEALRRWRAGRRRYAALLTDLHMPGIDGYGLAQTIRRSESAAELHPADAEPPRMPIIALTANALKGEALRARAAGIDDYLTKPVPLELLRHTLARWLGSAAATTRTAQPVWDAEAPRRLIGDDPQALVELLQDFLAMADGPARLIRDALVSHDAARAAAAAHRLKSAARATGALALAAACEDVERDSHRSEPAARAEAMVAFDSAYRAARVALEEALACRSGTASSASTSTAG